MRGCLVTLFFGLIALVAGGTVNFKQTKGWHVPQVDGRFKWVSRAQYDSEYAAIEARGVQVKFYLYTQSNRYSPKQINAWDSNALWSSQWNSGHQTRFVIHGWQNNYQSDVNNDVRNALLDTGAYNVFCVDWSAHAETLNYNSARWSVPEVGQEVANFLDFLNQQGGLSFNNLALIGHSLGAHVAGFAGKRVTRGKVRTIIGLDPALPLFSYSDCGARLCSTDASFVESIQTCGGLLGFLEPIGKAAFYPNGGKTQPGCGTDISGSCAHSRSYIYYAEAIRNNNFPTMKCSSYNSAVSKDCGATYSSVRMGAASNYGISGYYYVPVRSSWPYGMG